MTNRSSKIDAIIDIVKYHQQAPGRPPLAVKQQGAIDNTGRLNTLEPTVWDSPSQGLINSNTSRTPDKIVLFVIFPEHNPFLKAVSRLLFGSVHLIAHSTFIVFKAMEYRSHGNKRKEDHGRSR